MLRWMGAGGCTQHKTHSTGIPQLELTIHTTTSCDQGDAGQGQQLGHEQDEKRRGSHDGGMCTREGSEHHRLGRSRPGTCQEEAIPEEGNCHKGAHTRNIQAL